ncbi:TPA: 1-acyl-sn-glycerol-3-phosphate acyltransferase [Candidatus Avigastranaerophilus faecigallinarum]|nr:1-acyl-sn-glycerol-3-phosphate acyltransferase [Candidatus Avigastranaerophilus faecigallinarum]
MCNINKNNFIKFFFFLFIVKPFILWALGINVRGMEKLPKNGPAIIVANHNSHIDTLIIMSLFPCSTILNIHPIAAEDYFCNTKFKEFLFKTLIGIIPIKRKVVRLPKREIFKEINTALENNEIIILYPEGTRGEDNKLNDFKTGIAHIAAMNPNVPIIPLYINGPDKILPKIDAILVPFISDIYIADSIYYDNSATKIFTEKIRNIIEDLMLTHKRKETL